MRNASCYSCSRLDYTRVGRNDPRALSWQISLPQLPATRILGSAFVPVPIRVQGQGVFFRNFRFRTFSRKSIVLRSSFALLLRDTDGEGVFLFLLSRGTAGRLLHAAFEAFEWGVKAFAPSSVFRLERKNRLPLCSVKSSTAALRLSSDRRCCIQEVRHLTKPLAVVTAFFL